MALYAAATRWRLGQQLGADGEALSRQAEEWATTKGIRSPPRMLAMIVPGFFVSARSHPRLSAGTLPSLSGSSP